MSYSDPKYGVRRRVISNQEDDLDATGVNIKDDHFTFAKKTKIVKFGVVPTASDLICTSTTNFTLETVSGDDLGTFTPGSAALGSYNATGNTITATTIAENTIIQGNVTVKGDSGTFRWFVDVEEQFDVDDSA